MNRVEMIRLIEELNQTGWSPLANDASDEYFWKLWEAREEKLDETIKNAPLEWLPVTAGLFLNYPTQAEMHLAFPGRTFLSFDDPRAIGPNDEESWLVSVTALLDVWAKYAPEQVIVAMAPLVGKHGKQLSYGCGVVAETKLPEALPILKTGVADLGSLEDEDISLLFLAIACLSGVEAEHLLEELEQRILALPTIGPETAATLERHSTWKNNKEETRKV